LPTAVLHADKEVSLQVMMNPFFMPTTRIKSATFQQKVRAASKAYFR
jgi:Sedlin, N-terminal conserved region